VIAFECACCGIRGPVIKPHLQVELLK